MNAIHFSLKALGALALACVATAASALSMTLDTRALQANAVFGLSQDAVDALAASDTFITPLGTSSFGSPTKSATGDLLPSFNLPISKVNVSLGLPPFSPLVTPNSGGSSGAALLISRGSRSVTLANFVIDYSKEMVLADITANGVTTMGTSLYTFDATNLKIGLNGLTLNMHQQLNNLVFTSTALSTFSNGLKLSNAIQTPLKTLNFGAITIDINAAFRSPISGAAFVASVPEVPSTLMLGLGLVGLAAVSRRKQAG
ncbi:MAG: hypothetical protein Q7U28_16415 [Aquabacterium sp.]|nr:hypothetical protein [Aquabacterium sp.]